MRETEGEPAGYAGETALDEMGVIPNANAFQGLLAPEPSSQPHTTSGLALPLLNVVLR